MANYAYALAVMNIKGHILEASYDKVPIGPLCDFRADDAAENAFFQRSRRGIVYRKIDRCIS
jgi:hypothetical protein